jgi:5-formyltetrahydrofolate cyclo-ligase
MCVADDKKYWRKVLGECRRGLPIAYVTAVSRRVQAQVIASYCYRTAPTIVLYAAKDNEVATDLLLEDALGSQRLVLLPKIVPATRELLIVRLRNNAELIPGIFGILEPGGTEVVAAADLGPALFCVPGLAFSRTGQRLGRGGGYFDRTLAAIGPQTITAGLAYSFQLLDWLPQSPNDRRLNLIFTESARHAGQPLDRSVTAE